MALDQSQKQLMTEMDDVHPLPLTDEDDFFSDLGGDEHYIRGHEVGTGTRLVIGVDGEDDGTTSTSTTTVRPSRANPFGTTEVRARNSNHHTNGNNSQNGVSSEMRTPVDYRHDTLNVSNHGHQASNSSDNVQENTLHSSLGIDSHCHIPHEHEGSNTVRNQLIVISIVTTVFGIGETVGE